jgi:hypothetical protein
MTKLTVPYEKKIQKQSVLNDFKSCHINFLCQVMYYSYVHWYEGKFLDRISIARNMFQYLLVNLQGGGFIQMCLFIIIMQWNHDFRFLWEAVDMKTKLWKTLHSRNLLTPWLFNPQSHSFISDNCPFSSIICLRRNVIPRLLILDHWH